MNPKYFEESKTVATQGGAIAGNARKKLEAQTGRNVVTGENFLPQAKDPSVRIDCLIGSTQESPSQGEIKKLKDQ